MENTEYISKVRQKAVLTRQKRRDTRGKDVPFADSGTLALIYNVLFTVLVVGILTMFHGDLATKAGLTRLFANTFITIFAQIGIRMVLSMLSPEILSRNSRTCLILMISLLSIVVSGGTLRLLEMIPLGDSARYILAYTFPFVFPFILAPMLGTLLLGVSAGMTIGAGTSFIMMLFVDPPDSMLILTLGLLSSVVVPQLANRKIRRRFQLLRVSIVAGMILTIGVFLYPLLHLSFSPGVDLIQLNEDPAIWQALSCLITAFVSAFISMAMIPLFEHIFAVASDLTLQSFADLGHPILERLSLEAPGTYNHSIMVATMSVAAAERIGANPLLARVGAYYHDIGKLSTPPLFIENTTPEKNPHNTLKPTTSASWIKSHVKDGIVLAEKFSLPRDVKNIIWEHHGTTVMAYFLRKAKEMAKSEEEKMSQISGARRIIVEESQFRYPGPKPTSREAAIVMLADSVEAASRTLEKPTFTAIESLVSNIAESKLKDEQFDNCPMTMKDLANIKKSFVSSLMTILHARIPYPGKEITDDSGENREQTEKTQTIQIEMR